MHKILLLLGFVLCTNIFAAKEEPVIEENIKPIRIAFFIDDINEMFECDRTIGITRDFALTLSQESLDIVIVSNYILKNLILRKYTKNADQFFTEINFDLKKWDIYLVNNTQFFVLVPRDFNNPILNKKFLTKINLSSGEEYNGVGDDSYPRISWADTAPIEAKRLLTNKNLIYIPYAEDVTSEINGLGNSETEHKKFEPSQLSLIFTLPPKKADGLHIEYELNSMPPCNIYILGHGNYSPEDSIFKVAGIPANEMVNVLLFFNDKLNTKSVRLSSCYAGGEILDLMRIKNGIPIRMKYLFIVNSITDTETTTSIEGDVFDKTVLSEYFDAIDDFLNGCKSFVDKLNIIRAKKKTTPPEEIKSEIKSLEKSSGFEKILRSLSLPNDWYFCPNGPANFPQIWIPEIGWFQTFNIDHRIQKITDAKIIKSMVKSVDKLVEIKTKKDEVKQAHALGHLKFDSHDTIQIWNTVALLLYSEIIFANVNIFPCYEPLNSDDLQPWLSYLYKYFPSIPCIDSVCIDNPIEKNFYVYPQFISMQRKNGLNLFAKISLVDAGTPAIQTGILNFLRDSFLILRGRKTQKAFFIKELEGYNDFSEILKDNDDFKKELMARGLEKQRLTLQNVFISTKIVNLVFFEATHINISFEFPEGKRWVLDYAPSALNRKPGISPSRWRFKETEKLKYEETLGSFGLTYLAQLTPAAYYEQLPIIRDDFKKQNTKTLKEFICDFNSEANLKLKLKELKISLDNIKQKFLILSLKLDQLKGRLTSIV